MNTSKYKAPLFTLLDVQPKLTLKMAHKKLGISKAQFYLLKKCWKKELEKKKKTKSKTSSRKGKTSRLKPMPNVVQATQPQLTNWKPKFTLGDATQLQAARNHFAEFIGYRGHKDANGNVVLDPIGPIHRGEAFPPPINKEGKYLGVLDYELDTFELLFMFIEVMLKWAREHGKTFMATWFIEWSMIYCGKIGKDENGEVILDDQGHEIIVPESWLYFSVTKIKAKVGFWVFRWAKNHGYIVKASKGAKQNTYTNFELNNGAMMQIHDFLSEDPIGEHNWNFALDDIVKKSWQNRPSDTQKARNQWDILNYIGHVRVFIFGTKKYVDDPLEYLEEVLSDLVVDVKTPFVMEGVFPDWTPKLDENGKETLIAPQLHTHEELYKKRDASKEAWMAEEMQDPRPTAGKRWKKVEFVKQLRHMNNYDLLFIYIDRATTINLNSDYTGFIQGIREIGTGIRYIENDFTDHIVLEKLLFDVSEFMHNYKMMYKHLICVVIVEKQGGGDDFVSQVNTRSSFEWDGVQIPNYIREICNVLEVHSMGDKKKRIKDRLGAPIDNKRIKFMSYLKNSEIVNNILDYPYNKRIDALDALATGDFKLMEEYAIVERGRNAFEEIEILYKEHEERLRNPVSPLDFENQYLMNLGLRGKRKVFE